MFDPRIRYPFGDLVIVCFHTSSTFQHPLRNCTSPPLLSSSMSGWMADAAQAGAPAPPVTKAAPPRSTMPSSSIDDTPTEPATSPRMIDPQAADPWAVELQLPTKEIGPREEPERYVTRFIVNECLWTPEEHEGQLYKASQAWNYKQWNREAREAAERHNEEFNRSMEEWKGHRLQRPSSYSIWSTFEGDFIHASSSRCSRCSPAE